MSPAVGREGIALDCPAKINLLLRVGPARADWGGRHRLDTIYSAVSILDRVELRPREPGSGFRLHMEGEHLGDLANNDADPHANLAVKALLAMAQATGHQPDVAIRIIKRIPVGAGLTGRLLIGAYEDQLSTAQVYKAFDAIGPSPGDLNDLQKTACALHPRSLLALDLARRAGAGPAFVSGSGPSVVAMVPHLDQAATLIRLWREQNAVDRIIEADSPVQPRMVPLRVTHGQ